MRGGGISTAVQASDKADSTTNRRYVGKLDSIQKINEVIIVGTPVIPKYREVIPAQVLKEVDLQRLNSLSVADAIRYFAGVQLKDYGGVGGLKTVNIRSMGTNHMAVFYDGIQLGNAQNGQVDLGRFSLDDVEEISRSITDRRVTFSSRPRISGPREPSTSLRGAPASRRASGPISRPR